MKVILGDLRHGGAAGRHSCFMPIGLGYLASYALSKLEGRVDIDIHTDPVEMMDAIAQYRPRVVGLSNYSWNSNLVKLVFTYAKNMVPDVVCVAGGPEFPTDIDDCRDFLLNRADIDFYVYAPEGEQAFQILLQKVLSEDIESLRSTTHRGVMSVSGGVLLRGENFSRICELDTIPSPYLTGIMDKWFDGTSSPSIEMVRGCPYSCSYCVAADSFFNKVRRFSTERTKKELLYMAKRMTEHPGIMLLICDSNLGMYKEDEEIAHYIAELQDQYNWPHNFCVTTGKDKYDRIMRVSDLVHNKIQVTCGIQSMNPDTLEAISRRNKIKDYVYIAENLRKRKMGCAVEIISPLPLETQETFVNGLCNIIKDVKPDRICPYTTMMLKGTELSSSSSRKKYEMETKYRIVPRQFGIYNGEICIETEEVCIATNTMSFDDYLRVRGFAFVAFVFCGEEFDVLYRHLEECNIDIKDYMELMWNKILLSNSSVSRVYEEYIQETADELWDSEEDIINFYRESENYDSLVRSEVGDNLLRKYSIKILSTCCNDAISLFYECMMELADSVHANALLSARQWVAASRDVGNIFNSTYKTYDVNVDLSFDVQKWYTEGERSKRLQDYECAVTYNIKYPVEEIDTNLQSSKDLYGGDREYQIARFLSTWKLAGLWAKVQEVG